MKKSPFFDFFNRRGSDAFNEYLQSSSEGVDYISWNNFLLPNDYGDAELEYRAIRSSCAVFDVSPIRKFRIQGPAAGAFLDYLLTRPVSHNAPMRGIYVAYCNEDGSLKDDSILYKFSSDDYLLMPSDIDHSTHFEQVRAGLGIPPESLAITDCTHALVGVALQGPSSAAVLRDMGFTDIEYLAPFEVRDYALGEGSAHVARMGFTADLGYECWFKPEAINAFVQALESARRAMSLKIPGYGLTALESCRLEGGFVVAGWDFATEADPAPGFERSPFEIGLGWLVKLDGGDFVGREALLKQRELGFRYVLRSFHSDDSRIPEDGTAIYASVEGKDVQVGTINCAAWSWNLNRTIGNASIESDYGQLADAWVVIEGERLVLGLLRGPQLTLERRNQVPAAL